MNTWQVPIADVGTVGDDQGEGAKYFYLPPDNDGPVPDEGYIPYQADTYGIHFALRPVAKNGGTHADQAAYAQTLNWYPLAEADNPPATQFFEVP